MSWKWLLAMQKKENNLGDPLGSFQAVQHHCANRLIDVEGGRYITHNAAWMLNKGVPRTMQVAAAKVWASEACKEVVSLGHQGLGGIGYMAEHDMTLYSKRAKAAELSCGDANFYQKMAAKELGL